MGVPKHVQRLAARNEVQQAYASHARVREVFGAARETPLAEGLERMANWVRRVGARQTKEFTAIEVRKRLPAAWQTWDG
jgi:UDP-glucose 4-epimerase